MTFKVVITRVIEADYPGWVECEFYDAWGTRHTVQDKLPVFTDQNLDLDSSFPQAGLIRCARLRERTNFKGQRVITVSTEHPDHVQSMAGMYEFDLFENQMAE